MTQFIAHIRFYFTLPVRLHNAYSFIIVLFYVGAFHFAFTLPLFHMICNLSIFIYELFIAYPYCLFEHLTNTFQLHVLEEIYREDVIQELTRIPQLNGHQEVKEHIFSYIRPDYPDYSGTFPGPPRFR